MPTRVMHVITRLVRGGAQRIVLDLLAGLPRNRFEPMLVAGGETGPEGSLWAEARALDIEAIQARHLVRDLNPIQDALALRELSRLMRMHEPAIVHAHTSKAGLLAIAAARRNRVRGVVLAPHGHIMASGARIQGVPESGLKRTLLAWGARFSARLSHCVVVPNQSEYDEGTAFGLWSPHKARIVPNGVDTDRYRPLKRAEEKLEARRRLGCADASVVVGIVARLTPEKGVDVAISALAEVPGVTLVIAGDGPERQALEALARACGVEERVRFLGMHLTPWTLYPALDLLVVPSRSEAHGLVAAEAMACEIPVIASEVGGLRELVIDGVTGLRVPVADVTALASALRRLLADPDLAHELARAGRRNVVEHWSTRVMVEKTVELYAALLAR